MRHYLFYTLLLCLTALLGAAPAARATGSLALAAAPDVIYADGKSSTVVTATVRDSGGSLVPDGTSVRFTTNLGRLTPDTATTASGVARVSLTSGRTGRDGNRDGNGLYRQSRRLFGGRNQRGIHGGSGVAV